MKIVLFVLSALVSAVVAGVAVPSACLTDSHCSKSCPGGGLRLGKCLDLGCVCVTLPIKRDSEYIKKGPCMTDKDCHERCDQIGMFFGRCLLDRCSCYTLPGKRSECFHDLDCPEQPCRGEFQLEPICVQSQRTCACAPKYG